MRTNEAGKQVLTQTHAQVQRYAHTNIWSYWEQKYSQLRASYMHFRFSFHNLSEPETANNTHRRHQLKTWILSHADNHENNQIKRAAHWGIHMTFWNHPSGPHKRRKCIYSAIKSAFLGIYPLNNACQSKTRLQQQEFKTESEVCLYAQLCNLTQWFMMLGECLRSHSNVNPFSSLDFRPRNCAQELCSTPLSMGTWFQHNQIK